MANQKLFRVLFIISVILVIIGALNWGWVGLTSDNIVHSLNNATFRDETFERILYVLIGLAGLFLIYFFIAMNRKMD